MQVHKFWKISSLFHNKSVRAFSRTRRYSIKKDDNIERVVQLLLNEHKSIRRKAANELKRQQLPVVANTLVSLSQRVQDSHKMGQFLHGGWSLEELGSILNHTLQHCETWRDDGWHDIVVSLVGLYENKKESLSLISQLPVTNAPNYDVPISNIDYIHPDYQVWKSKPQLGYNASEIGDLIYLLSNDEYLTTPKLLVDLMDQRKLKNVNDDTLNHTLHTVNVAMATIAGRSDLKLKNNQIGTLLSSYNTQVIQHLKKENLLIKPEFYINWVALLIAETAERRKKQYHDLLLIKHLLDTLMAEWPHEEAQACSRMIEKKFTVSRWFKLTFLGK